VPAGQPLDPPVPPELPAPPDQCVVSAGVSVRGGFFAFFGQQVVLGW